MLYGTENGERWVEGLEYTPKLTLQSPANSEYSDYYIPLRNLCVEYAPRVTVAAFCPVWFVTKREKASYGDGERVYYRQANHAI